MFDAVLAIWAVFWFWGGLVALFGIILFGVITAFLESPLIFTIVLFLVGGYFAYEYTESRVRRSK